MNLVVHHGALGDFVLLFPLLRSLAPQRTVVAAASSKAAMAARLFPHVEAVDIEGPRFSRLHREHGELVRGDLLLSGATRVFSFVSNGRDAWAANARAAMPEARIHFIEPRPPAGWNRHVCDWHAAQLREQGWTSAEQPVARRARSDGPIVIHPGSGGEAKCWPLARFESLIDRLRAAGRTVLPVIGEVELERWPAPDRPRWRDHLAVRHLTSLIELCDTLQSARAFIGNDSGPAHLAAQLGLPTVALFGPTDPAVWSPRGPDVTLLAPPMPAAMQWLGVESVMELAGRL